MEERLIPAEKELVETAFLFKERVGDGLRLDGGEIKAIPAFITQANPPVGARAFALDLGGSNLRAALVAFGSDGPHFERGPLSRAMPWKRNEAFPREAYLDIQAELLEALGVSDAAPLGYCFSYPARSTADGDAELIDWTKGISVSGTRRAMVGRMLLDRLSSRAGSVRITSVRVINDTIATLFAGLADPPVDAYIGLVVGTGTNMAAFVDAGLIPKLSQTGRWSGPLPVNLESGNFHPPFLTRWDEEVDAASENPGVQRFEKAVSGLYLGRTFKALAPEADFDPESGAEGLVRFMDHHGRDHLGTAARHVYERSAMLTAAALAGLTVFLGGGRVKTLRIVAEGGLFWSRPQQGAPYADVVETAFASLIRKLGMDHLMVSFSAVRDATLIGSALAAFG